MKQAYKYQRLIKRLFYWEIWQLKIILLITITLKYVKSAEKAFFSENHKNRGENIWLNCLAWLK